MLNGAADTFSAPDEARSLLIVEDNETTRRRMSDVLRADGYEVTEAVDGLDALRKLSACSFDAILLDLVLPRVDGWEFRATQLQHPELALIPTVIVTVQPLREPARYALRTSDVVQKPFEDATLLQAVQRVCGARSPAQRPMNADSGRLFWSRRGEIACAVHAPDATSSQWREERWAPVLADGSNSRIVYQCQHCPGDGSPIDRSHRMIGPHGSYGRRTDHKLG